MKSRIAKEYDQPFITDSSLYRLMAYTHVTNLIIDDKVFLEKANYDLIIYCPIEFPFVPDGFR